MSDYAGITPSSNSMPRGETFRYRKSIVDYAIMSLCVALQYERHQVLWILFHYRADRIGLSTAVWCYARLCVLGLRDEGLAHLVALLR
jgi:hypothetical protein